MNCCAVIMKYVLFIFNLFFLVCGILLIILGSIILVNLNELNNVENLNNPTTIPILIIILGSIVTIISFFGCCGSIIESNCLTITYCIFMVIALALQVALAVWVATQRESFIFNMGSLVEIIWEFNVDANGWPMYIMELGFNCCGLDSHTDYINIDAEVPLTCCGPVDICFPEDYIHKRGCKKAFMDFWETSTVIIHYFGICVALIEFSALVLACCLASNIRKSNRKKALYKDPY